MTYTNQDYEQLLVQLESLSDENYRVFNESLVPGLTGSFGVRIPRLRALAKDLAKGDWRGFLQTARDDTQEERLLQAMVIGAAKCELDERLAYIAWFVPKINNWSVCDCFCVGLKSCARQPEKVHGFLNPYLASAKEFELRFAVVMLMTYFITEAYIDEVLSTLAAIRHNGYYVKMAVAWALSVCFVKFRGKTLPLLEENMLDPFTHNKTIQKIRESYRVSKEDKDMLKDLKKSL